MMALLVNIGEIGFGILFLISAIFNLSYTLRHGKEFYRNFATNAWFGPYKALIRIVVIPHTTVFTILLVVLLVSLALMILTRGSFVKPALIAGAVFSLAVVPASNLPGAIANLAMAAALALLALAH
jgi:hypothetical protein